MLNNLHIAVLIPAFNEEGKIGTVVQSVLKDCGSFVDEVVVINDGSRDNTSGEARAAGARVIDQEKNQGVGAALRTGMQHAVERNMEIIVVMGGDNQDSASQMLRLLRPLVDDNWDFVQGSRYMAGGERVNIPLFRWITTGFYSFLFKVLIRFPVSDGTNGYRAFRSSILKDPEINLNQRWLNRYELEPYLFYKVIERGCRVTEAPVTKSYPLGKIGYSKMVPILDWWSILKPLVYLRLGIRK
jgi:dolichol-phosphate mannosyltransferase